MGVRGEGMGSREERTSENPKLDQWCITLKNNHGYPSGKTK